MFLKPLRHVESFVQLRSHIFLQGKMLKEWKEDIEKLVKHINPNRQGEKMVKHDSMNLEGISIM